MALRLSTYTACTLHCTCHACDALHAAGLQSTVQRAVLPLRTQIFALTKHGGLITENKDF